MKMLPLTQFAEILQKYQEQMNEDFNELVTAAQVIGRRPNYLTLDENGYYHVQASGKIDEVINSVNDSLNRLLRIKRQRDGFGSTPV